MSYAFDYAVICLFFLCGQINFAVYRKKAGWIFTVLSFLLLFITESNKAAGL